jgi:hypothetical protein
MNYSQKFYHIFFSLKEDGWSLAKDQEDTRWILILKPNSRGNAELKLRYCNILNSKGESPCGHALLKSKKDLDRHIVKVKEHPDCSLRTVIRDGTMKKLEKDHNTYGTILFRLSNICTVEQKRKSAAAIKERNQIEEMNDGGGSEMEVVTIGNSYLEWIEEFNEIHLDIFEEKKETLEESKLSISLPTYHIVQIQIHPLLPTKVLSVAVKEPSTGNYLAWSPHLCDRYDGTKMVKL